SEGISYDWNAPLHRLTVSATDELRLRRFRLVPSGTEIAGPDVGAHSSITVSDSAIGAVTIDGTKTRPRRRRSPRRVTIDGVRGWVELGESSVVAFAGSTDRILRSVIKWYVGTIVDYQEDITSDDVMCPGRHKQTASATVQLLNADGTFDSMTATTPAACVDFANPLITNLAFVSQTDPNNPGGQMGALRSLNADIEISEPTAGHCTAGFVVDFYSNVGWTFGSNVGGDLPDHKNFGTESDPGPVV